MDPITSVVTKESVLAASEISKPARTAIGKTIADFWYVLFGSKWDEKCQIKQLEVQDNIEKFKENIKNKVNKIKEEDLKEPDLDIIGSTLESSKYRLGKEEIRDLFSNLIAASMNKKLADDVHPSFVEIIKQMSPLDSKTLFYIYTTQDETISKIIVEYNSGAFNEIYSNVYLANAEEPNLEKVSQSIDILMRLGLIEVNYNLHKTDDTGTLYLKHKQNYLFKQAEDKVNKRKEFVKNVLEELKQYDISLINQIDLKEKISDIKKSGSYHKSV